MSRCKVCDAVITQLDLDLTGHDQNETWCFACIEALNEPYDEVLEYVDDPFDDDDFIL